MKPLYDDRFFSRISVWKKKTGFSTDEFNTFGSAVLLMTNLQYLSLSVFEYY